MEVMNPNGCEILFRESILCHPMGGLCVAHLRRIILKQRTRGPRGPRAQASIVTS